jgi:sporulation protein YqfC
MNGIGQGGAPVKDRRKGIVTRAIDVFDLPGEVIAGLPKLTLVGNSRLHIEGHKGILEYDSSQIAINGGKLILKLRGENLEVTAMSAEEMLIRGTILSIEFE